MAPLYEEVCKDLSWPVDNNLLETMKKINEEQLKKLDDAIEDAEKNLGEMEVREAYLNKAEYLSRIGSKVSFFIISINISTLSNKTLRECLYVCVYNIFLL